MLAYQSKIHKSKLLALLHALATAIFLLWGMIWVVQPAYAAAPHVVECPANGDGPENLLRTAITTLNSMAAMDTIIISVTDAACVFTFTDAAVTSAKGPVGLPVIAREVRIRAVGGRAVIERSATAPRFRLIESYTNLFLENVTLRNGAAAPTQYDSHMSGSAIYAHQALTLTNAILTENAGDQGGAVFALGTLVMDQVTVSDNRPQSSYQSEGGGIFTRGNLFATNITVTNNLSELYGGGIYVGGSAVISAATFHGNQAQHYNGIGGGLYVVGDLTLSSSLFTSNTAGYDGGGIYVEGASSLTDVHFMHNIAGNSGGGITAAKNLLARIESSRFINNQAALGGGASIQRGIVQNTLFENNRAGGSGYYFGGGALLVGLQAMIQNNRFISNSAPLGGAVQFLFYPPGNSFGGSQVINNLWIDNDATNGTGGALSIGIDVDGILGGYVEIQHNTITRQTRSISSAVFIARSSSDLANNIITHHRIGIHGTGATVLTDANLLYANTTNYVGILGASNDLIADPLFLDPAADNYHLQATSPARDSGVDMQVAVDFDGIVRPQGKGLDRGAFEYINQAPVAQSESYTTSAATPLVMAMPGVLANDSDSDGDAMTVTPVSTPAHGLLRLEPTGAFIYTPTMAFHGSESFTYSVDDGALQSSVVTVTIQVTAEETPHPVEISGLSVENDGPGAVGQIINFSATFETGSDIQFAWDFGDGDSAQGATSSHIYAAAGDYTVTLTASNSLGSKEVTTTVSVQSEPDDPNDPDEPNERQQISLPLVTK